MTVGPLSVGLRNNNFLIISCEIFVKFTEQC